VAVLVVVLYHSDLGILSQGYLGVDVFFVLSGFLITSIILKGLDNHNFSFSSFYLRRAKRLFPALYSTLFFTTLLSTIILTHQQWVEYLEQLMGALTFTANMILPSQTGYFEGTSEGKPLLHIWSLSLEEQYYFLLPISLYILPKKHRLFGLITFTLISLYWCLSWVYDEKTNPPFLWRLANSSKSEWAFYLLFTRAWELLGGSLCAWLVLNKPALRISKLFKISAILLISYSCCININNEHPSIESIIVVVSTMVILIGSDDWLSKHFIVQIIEKIGDWSYSIYLVHWPLFAFAYLSYVGDVPTSVKVLLIAISILVGYIQFKYVEIPFRDGKYKNIFSSWKVNISAVLIFLAMPVSSAFSTKVEDKFSHIRRINYGLDKECSTSFDKHNKLKSSCSTGNQPNIVIWGDSYAMHLVPGLSIKNKKIIQITKSVCGPFLNLAPITNKYDSVWAKSCIDFNDNAINYIQNHPDITHAVLSSNFSNYLKFENFSYLTKQGVIKGSYPVFLNSFKKTIKKLKDLNIVPVIISPLPKAGFDVGECLERKHGSAILLREVCNIDYSEYQKQQLLVINLLKEIQKETNVVWLEDYLCKNKSCQVDFDDKFIYRDMGHFSIDGSIKLLKNLNIEKFN